ncbi:hypothetical protein [Ekhidna sp.]|uniref:hypothetical protein n=1 Tax=Ekhidna sp. TaxID=2608089 RepID=UPI003BAC4AF9
MKKIIAIQILICMLFQVPAQLLEKETIIDLSKKDSRFSAFYGFPNEVIVNDQNQQFELVYVNKVKRKSIKRNRLVFDYDLNLISDHSEEIEVRGYDANQTTVKTDAAKMPANYKGEDYTTTMLTLGGLMNNKIEKTEAKYDYNWTSRTYDVETKVIEKVKAKELVGKTMQNPYVLHYNNAAGDLLYVSGTLNKKRLVVDAYKVHRIKPNMESEVVAEWSFDYVQRHFFGGWFLTETGDVNMILIFANAGGKVYKPKVNQAPKPNEWTYVRLSSKGELMNKASFKTKANNWQILGAYEKDGSVYVYGPGESKGVNEKHQDILAAIGTGKQDVFQILKITDDNVDFVTGPTLDEINQLSVKPAGQKKKVEYDGKRVAFGNLNIAPNRDIFINAQDWSLDARSTKPLYKSLLMFQFAADGTFKRLYGIESQKEKAGIGGAIDPDTDPRFFQDQGQVFAGPNGNMFWNTFTVNQINKYVSKWTEGSIEYTQTTIVKRFTGAIAKFDPESGTLEDYQKLGDDKFLLYALPSEGIPSISIDGGKKKIFLGYGSTKDTKNQIWLGKLDPAKL